MNDAGGAIYGVDAESPAAVGCCSRRSAVSRSNWENGTRWVGGMDAKADPCNRRREREKEIERGKGEKKNVGVVYLTSDWE